MHDPPQNLSAPAPTHQCPKGLLVAVAQDSTRSFARSLSVSYDRDAVDDHVIEAPPSIDAAPET